MGSGARPDTPALSGGGVLLRLAVPADVPEVAALEQLCFADPWPASAFSTLTDNSRVFFAVARDEPRGRLVGYVVAWYVMDEGELANLAVAPTQRTRGLGRELLDAMLQDAASRGTAEVYLEVRESNSAALKLYSTRDFTPVGRRKGYYRNPKEDALILRRSLKSKDVEGIPLLEVK